VMRASVADFILRRDQYERGDASPQEFSPPFPPIHPEPKPSPPQGDGPTTRAGLCSWTRWRTRASRIVRLSLTRDVGALTVEAGRSGERPARAPRKRRSGLTWPLPAQPTTKRALLVPGTRRHYSAGGWGTTFAVWASRPSIWARRDKRLRVYCSLACQYEQRSADYRTRPDRKANLLRGRQVRDRKAKGQPAESVVIFS
jgi:hypothetical protein